MQRRIMPGWASYAKYRDVFKSNLYMPEEACVQLMCAASYDIWCRDQPNTELNITYKDRETTISVRDRTKVIDIIGNMRKKYNSSGQGTPTALNTTDGARVSPLADHMSRRDDKRDQPSDGETTWNNIGAKRSRRGQHKTG